MCKNNLAAWSTYDLKGEKKYRGEAVAGWRPSINISMAYVNISVIPRKENRRNGMVSSREGNEEKYINSGRATRANASCNNYNIVACWKRSRRGAYQVAWNIKLPSYCKKQIFQAWNVRKYKQSLNREKYEMKRQQSNNQCNVICRKQ